VSESNERQTIIELEARLRQLEEEVRRLSGEGASLELAGQPENRVSRRGLFWAAGALAAGAMGAEVLRGIPAAQAADGSAIIAGQSNSDTATTLISGSVLSGPALQVANYLVGGFDAYSDAFQAYTFGPGLAAIYGRNDAVGGSAIMAYSGNGTGATFRGGLAPIRLQPATAAGSPTTFNHLAGELYVDANGALWLCTANGDATHVGTFKQVATTDLGLHVIATPKRIYSNSLAANALATALDATHATDGTLSGVPVGAQAAYGVVTAKVTGTVVGAMTFYADGTTEPAGNNFMAPVTTAYCCSPVLIPLSAAGRYAIHVYSTSFSFWVDVWGYVQ
jgi:hypothetical protein